MIPSPPFSGIELGPFHLSMYGLLIAVGALVALRMVVRRYSSLGGDPDLAERATLAGGPDPADMSVSPPRRGDEAPGA